MLKVKNISGGYKKKIKEDKDDHKILKKIDFEISKNKTLAIIGQNGAGKSTVARAIIGSLPYKFGEILFENINIINLSPLETVAIGIGYFLQGGQIFPQLTVKENLIFAGIGLTKTGVKERIEELKKYFVFLNSIKLKENAGSLSGGEKHQLSLAMVLMMKPKFVILDEPSAGLSPVMVIEMYEILRKVRNANELTILLIEQNVIKAVEFADEVLILKTGEVANKLKADSKDIFKKINKHYFGK